MSDDPRMDFSKALAWAVSKARAVTPEQLDAASPCVGWTVRQVIEHAAGAAGYIVTAFGAPPAQTAGLAPAAAFAQNAEAALAVIEDDDALTKEVDWVTGKVPGAALLGIFTPEFLVHGWDIATGTGQDAEAPAALAEATLAAAKIAVPAEGRNPAVFGPVVQVPEDSGPTRKLAAWLGR
ncbi:MAG: TIGR03086 family protein [Propionibacteriaceae bacterium]|jgi:uncharacterized protein (TIGR03086 family)|nr:TIGR03086 family protein [Propionibacteriaceae bacterium]